MKKVDAEQLVSSLGGTLFLGMTLCSYGNSLLFETCQTWQSVPGQGSSQ